MDDNVSHYKKKSFSTVALVNTWLTRHKQFSYRSAESREPTREVTQLRSFLVTVAEAVIVVAMVTSSLTSPSKTDASSKL